MSNMQHDTKEEMPRPTKYCPFCGEEILAVAIKCKHCQSMLNEENSPTENSTEQNPAADTILDIPTISAAAKTQQDLPRQQAEEESRSSLKSSPEQTIIDVGCNLKSGIESVGGRLLVTDQGLHFKAHMINLQRMPLDLRYDEIDHIAKRNNLGFVPNGLEVFIKSGESYRLTLNKRDKIADYIETKI